MTRPEHVSRYTTPEAMSRALTDHLRRQAKQSGIEHSNLRRQFAYDRLLARVFTTRMPGGYSRAEQRYSLGCEALDIPVTSTSLADPARSKPLSKSSGR